MCIPGYKTSTKGQERVIEILQIIFRLILTHKIYNFRRNRGETFKLLMIFFLLPFKEKLPCSIFLQCLIEILYFQILTLRTFRVQSSGFNTGKAPRHKAPRV